MISRINSIGINPAYLNVTTRPVQPQVAFKGLEQDTFTPSVKPVSTTVQPQLSENEQKALAFGKDLNVLVESKNATASEIQKLIQKHLGLDNVKIRSMSEYQQPNRPGVEMKKAAVTRPNFDVNGKLINVEVFIPDVDYNNKNEVLAFLDKTTHEITHVIQYTKTKEVMPHYAPTPEARFMNFIQKRITDRLTDKGVTDSAVAYIKEANYPLNTTEDYDKFMDLPTDKVTPERLGEIMKFGKDSASQKQTINAIFDLIFDETLKGMQYEKDPNALATIQKYGGMEAFKSQIKSICAKSLKDEQEAYNAGNIMRKEMNGVADKQTYNDLISTLMGMYSQALS
ncbi:hypothetical protein IKL64_03275 [bacterium]|nr:hypothetical protein [bacterium]